MLEAVAERTLARCLLDTDRNVQLRLDEYRVIQFGEIDDVAARRVTEPPASVAFDRFAARITIAIGGTTESFNIGKVADELLFEQSVQRHGADTSTLFAAIRALNSFFNRGFTRHRFTFNSDVERQQPCRPVDLFPLSTLYLGIRSSLFLVPAQFQNRFGRLCHENSDFPGRNADNVPHKTTGKGGRSAHDDNPLLRTDWPLAASKPKFVELSAVQ